MTQVGRLFSLDNAPRYNRYIIYLFVYWILLQILLDSKPPSSAARSALVSSQLPWELNLV